MATSFPTKLAPTSSKLRGGYYTPKAIADALAEWVRPAGPRLLEPSCGDGQVLASMTSRATTTVGVELDPVEATRAARRCPEAEIIQRDFFEWFDLAQHGQWDGCAGNPPFIRFQHWTEPTRGMAFDLMRYIGLRPTKLTNAWVPFVVAAALALREGGRLALVLPAELLQVGYASELRSFLVDEFTELTTIAFRRLVFADILQEVVLVLGERGAGPASMRVVEVEDAQSLPPATALAALPHAPALRHEKEKWTKYFLDPAEIVALREVRDRAQLPRLGELAEVDVGIVTGRNQFFVLRPSSARSRKLADEYLLPLVSKSAHLKGIMFDPSDLVELENEDALCRLLAVEESLDLDDHETLSAYVQKGESERIHMGYKCSIRKQWWVVPSVWTPDAFMLRQIHDHPRIIANRGSATSTDTIHRIRVRPGVPADALAAASINSATFAFSEVMGRSYGGGVLELEPREAEELPIPDPTNLTESDISRVDQLVRTQELEAAMDLVDQRLLIDTGVMDVAVVEQLRAAWKRLRDRRTARGRKPHAPLERPT